MRTILSLLLITFNLTAAFAQTEPDPEKAFTEAQRSGRKILLVFSGSDWCIPCIKFEKNILSDSAFRKFAGERLVVVQADFPQRKKIAPKLKMQYEALADAFNPEGAFPKLVLLDSDKKQRAVLSYKDMSPEEFIAQVKRQLP